MDRSNPYILLGIPFGSSREVALAAFAKKSRPLRRQGAQGKAMMSDLTWALNQITESVRDADSTIGIYRIPADPDAFSFTGDGVLRPGAEDMPRRYDRVADAEEALRRRAAHEFLRYLAVVGMQHTQNVAP